MPAPSPRPHSRPSRHPSRRVYRQDSLQCSQARSRRSSLAACQLSGRHRSQHCSRVSSLVQLLRPSQPKCPRGNRVRCPAHSQVCSQAPALPRSRRSNLVEIRPHSPVYVQALCLRCSLLLSQVSDPVVTQALNQPDGQVRNPQRNQADSPLVSPRHNRRDSHRGNPQASPLLFHLCRGWGSGRQ